MATNLPMFRPIESQSSYAGILREQERFSGVDDSGIAKQLNSGFDRLMLQSGLGLSPATIMSLCMFCGVVLGGMILVVQENPLTCSIGLLLGAVLPLLYVIVIRMNRQRKMTAQLPGMIEELARSAKTGRSVDQCCSMVADDTPDPLGSELRVCSRRMQMGEDIATALSDLPERTGLTALNILVTTLSVHQTTGGDLVMVLERLAQTIRDRLLFQGRLRAVTIGSRATAILMLVLPAVILIFFTLRDPNYLPLLLSTYWGKVITIVAVVLEIIGSVVVLTILRRSQQT